MFSQLPRRGDDERIGHLEHELPSRRLALGPVDHLVASVPEAKPSAVGGEDFFQTGEARDKPLAQQILQGSLRALLRIGGLGCRLIFGGLGADDDRPGLGDEVGGLPHFLGNSGKNGGVLVLGGDDPLLGIEIGAEVSDVHLADDLAHLIQSDVGSGHAEEFP